HTVPKVKDAWQNVLYLKCISIKVLTFLLIVFMLSLTRISNAQDYCATPHNLPNLTYWESGFQYDDNPICVNVFFHIVRQSNGTGGYTNTNFNNLIQILNSAYNTHNILFNFSGFDYINNDTWANMTVTEANINAITLVNQTNNALGIYIMPNSLYTPNGYGVAGAANAIPGRGLIIDKNFVTQSTLSHEIGHCLNLFHTHHGSSCEFSSNNPNYCQEMINGSNCTSCGDYICDTPADPCLSGVVNASCMYIGNQTQNGIPYQPLTNNYMSYSLKECRTQFTTGQGLRMRQALLNNSILNGFVSTGCYKITGADLICTNSSYTISNFPTSAQVYWSASPNNVVSFNSNIIPNPAITLINPNNSGKFTLTATITYNGSTFSISKVIKYGKPYFQYQTLPPPYPEAVVFDPNIENCNEQCYHTSQAKLYSTSDAVNATSVTWQKMWSLPSNYGYWNGHNNSVSILFKAANQMVHLKRTASNTCGSIFEEYEFCSNNTYCTSGYRQAPIKFNIYPNPTTSKGKLFIKLEDAAYEDIMIEVLDADGNIVLLKNCSSNTDESITLPTLKTGVYYVRIGDNTQKLIIK
ncbi:MAG TPA: T9SS type A sorting domain-containing protein, partial [Chitinophagales bacterium]|nr:T9SS type A sorting domain-containing protein [Chitinophagales bacterium]